VNKKRLAGVLGLAAGGMVVWVAFSGRRPPALPTPLTFQSGGKVEKLTLSPDGRLLADDCPAAQVKLFDTATGDQKYAFGVRTDWMVFSSDGRRLLTVDQRQSPSAPNGVVQTWDTATGAQVSRFVVPPALLGLASAPRPSVASLSPDLRRVVVRAPQRSAVYDLGTGRLLKALPAPTGRYTLAFSPDARWLAVGDESGTGGLVLWDTKTWRPVHALDRHGVGVSGIRFSPDGTRLALGSKAGLAWWDTRTWKPEGRFAMPAQGGLSRGYYFFSSDSQSLLTNEWHSSVTLHQVDCGTGRETLTAQGQLTQHVSLAGNRAETCGLPGKFQLLYRETYCIWDTRRRQVLYQIKIPPGPNSSLMGDFQFHVSDLSANGHVFAAGGSDDGVIRVWRLP